MDLLDDDELERSAVVANCRMNRERNLVGTNGYAKELGFNPLDILQERTSRGGPAAWLDLCCGSGKALIEAARIVHDQGLGRMVTLVGVDLVGMFLRPDPDLLGLRLVKASLSDWCPDRHFDVITCVHGLHYVGDKLRLIARASSWLTEDGLFVASLDLQNLKRGDGGSAGRRVATALRREGLEYDPRRRLLRCRGKQSIDLPFRYLGADDRAGPNSTGQPAVNSFYEGVSGTSRAG
ncbi:Methyltransferase domain-containing protein [Singulisphaera sp. GP187]|uniref:class I SAM-dependent methyltransferase n=1 Tax=Singulisphaera sp. GP187 TaxID=1882752 RepID=UPI000929AAF3|nr:class I SAM-dependent methyltransferase [Singulisphaera sp. GP187]SIO59125.1 Methyltransferase domain-containing protein [Singulisphaera sp. GP187]